MKSRDAGAWFEQPLVWLGAAVILLASAAACIIAIVLAARHADTPVETGSGNVLKVPLRHSDATLQHAQERR
jgi:sugar phosphate permease